jgi:hypothetical protein
MKPRPAFHNGSFSGKPQTSRNRLAITQQAVGGINDNHGARIFNEMANSFQVLC